MAIIFSNSNNFTNHASVVIRKQTKKPIIVQDGDFIFFYEDDLLTGINIQNVSKYFEVEDGTHSLSKEQREFFKNKKIDFDMSSQLVVGKIIERHAHPKSDRLFVLKIMTNREMQIITNSLNSLVDKHVIVALDSAFLPSNLWIENSKILDVFSEGMLCGASAFNLSRQDGVLLVEGNPGTEYEF